MEASVEGCRIPSTRNACDSREGYRIHGELSEGQLECVSTLGPVLHESMQSLIIGASFLVGESENKVCEACIPDPIPDYLRKTIIPGMRAAKIPSTLEGVEIML